MKQLILMVELSDGIDVVTAMAFNEDFFADMDMVKWLERQVMPYPVNRTIHICINDPIAGTNANSKLEMSCLPAVLADGEDEPTMRTRMADQWIALFNETHNETIERPMHVGSICFMVSESNGQLQYRRTQ